VASRLVIVGCGKDKLDTPARAAVLYTGPYFYACKRAALTLAWGDPDAELRVLSALHGLLRYDQVVDPYDKRLGQPGSVTAAKLRAQARRQRLLGAPVTVLANKGYTALVRQVWPDAAAPLEGAGPIGKQLHVLKTIYEAR
jgi:hypothetical protein